MSYIQKEIGGKLRGLKFNQGALMIFTEKSNPKRENATFIYALIYAGLAANADAKEIEFADTDTDGKQVPITYEMVCDWVDELSNDDQNDVITAFKSSTIYLKKVAPIIEDEEKKNQQAIAEITEPEVIEPIATESQVS